MSHALIIGGTGMLKNVTLHLLKKFDTVSVIARNEEGFDTIKNLAGEFAPKLNEMRIDYCHYHELTGGILKALEDYGEISLVVSWIHSSAPLAAMFTAKIINEKFSKSTQKVASGSRFYEIFGSEAANPALEKVDRQDEFLGFDNLSYRKVVLGFVIEDGLSRWLTDEEISNGVIMAIERNHWEYTVGVTEPWDKKP